MMKQAILAVFAAMAIVTAAPAQADPDGDYLGVLGNSPGVLGGAVNNAIYVNQGHRACDLLHGGASHDDVVGQLVMPPYVAPWLARAMVDAAQATLCPDTRH
jgi:hypothetical protein